MIERLFNSYDVRGAYPQPLNEEGAWKVGYATAMYLQRSRQGSYATAVSAERTIVVGRDARSQSPAMAGAMIEGIRAGGTDVVDLGIVDTPLIYFAVNHLDCVAGIMVSGTHAAEDQVAFQISGPKARPIANATGLEDIRRIAGTLRVGRTGLQGKLQQQDLWASYRRHVLQFLKLNRPLRVVADASNGVAGWMVPAVFDHLPHLEIIPLHFETGGARVHGANPLDPASTHLLCERVVAEHADLGICFAGDAGRSLFIDERGQVLAPDITGAVLARNLLSAGGNGAPVVCDLRCGRALTEEIAAAGGKIIRERVGKPAIKRAMADNRAIFGIELSGHYYFRDNYNADSGAIALAQMLTAVSGSGTPLSEMAGPLKRYYRSSEINFAADSIKIGLRELADKYRRARIDYTDGISVDEDNWWFNLRKSNLEPVFRLNIEAADPSLVTEKVNELQTLLGEPVQV